MNKRTQYNIFLSYAWQNKALANRIYFDLTRSGMKVWKDDQTKEKAWELWEKISGIIDHCRYFLLLDSPDARGSSNWVPRECQHAYQLFLADRLKIVVALVDNHDKTHSKKELFKNHNERLYFDFSNLKAYDFDGKYQQNITELCSFFDREYVPWTDIPTDQDFELELSTISHLDTDNRSILIKDYEVFQYRYQNNFTTSASRLNNLIEDCKLLQVDIVSLYLALGRLQMKQENYHEALSTFNRASRRFMDEPRVFMGLGTVHFYLENFGAAVQAYHTTEKLIQLNSNPKHRNHLQDVYRNLLLVHVEAQQFRQASAIYEKLDDNQRQLPEVEKAYAEILISQNRREEAIFIHERLFRDRAPAETDSYLEMAYCYKHFQNYEAAISTLELGIKSCSEKFELKKELSYLYYGQKAYSKAAKILETIKETSEGPNLQVHVELATIYHLMIRDKSVRFGFKRSQLEKKKESYCHFSKQYKAVTPLDYYLQGQACYINENFQQARALFEQCCHLDADKSRWTYYNAFL